MTLTTGEDCMGEKGRQSPAGFSLNLRRRAQQTGPCWGVLGSVKEMKAGDGRVLLASVCEKVGAPLR